MTKYGGIRFLVEKACRDIDVPVERKEWLINALKEYVQDHIDVATGKIDGLIEMVEQPGE